MARPLEDNDLQCGGLWHSLVAILGHISPLDIVLTKDFCPGNPATVLTDVFLVVFFQKIQILSNVVSVKMLLSHMDLTMEYLCIP